jgi:hypothetical protein
LFDDVLGPSSSSSGGSGGSSIERAKRSARRSITHLVRLGSASSVSSSTPATLARSASGMIDAKGEAETESPRTHPQFGLELADLMAAQAATHPHLKVPLFLHKTLAWLTEKQSMSS